MGTECDTDGQGGILNALPSVQEHRVTAVLCDSCAE